MRSEKRILERKNNGKMKYNFELKKYQEMKDNFELKKYQEMKDKLIQKIKIRKE